MTPAYGPWAPGGDVPKFSLLLCSARLRVSLYGSGRPVVCCFLMVVCASWFSNCSPDQISHCPFQCLLTVSDASLPSLPRAVRDRVPCQPAQASSRCLLCGLPGSRVSSQVRLPQGACGPFAATRLAHLLFTLRFPHTLPGFGL